jgi:hypothetical protein
MISVESGAAPLATRNTGRRRNPPVRSKAGFLGEILQALHESRAKQVAVELACYAHLIEYARQRPLTIDRPAPSADEEPRDG